MAGYFSPWGLAVQAGVLFCVWKLLLFLYRVTLHPLAKFPGPKLAAMTYKYEFYFDGIKIGMYTAEIVRMHEQYGMIITWW
jgi:hypothetical protein